MPGSLNYSPSGSEGGRSLGGDLDKSLIGVDLTTTPGKRDRYIGTHRVSSPMYLDLVSSAMQLLSSPLTSKTSRIMDGVHAAVGFSDYFFFASLARDDSIEMEKEKL